MTSVWPALWPPWKRTTTSARCDSQSTILPLPSSPHWAPITATFAIRNSPGSAQRGRRAVDNDVAAFEAPRFRRGVGDRRQAGDGDPPFSAQPTAEGGVRAERHEDAA